MTKYNLDYFQKKSWSLVLIKNSEIIYRSKKQGLAPLIFCLKNKPGLLRGATVYDKLVGRAATLLMIYGKVKEVMTPAISRMALVELKKNNINSEYGEVVGKIMNRKGDDLCPMEKLSSGKSAEEFAGLLLNR